jgi:hypothetical protein
MTGVKVAPGQGLGRAHGVPTPVHDTMVGVTARETILAVKARDGIVGVEGSLLSFRSRPQVRPTST